MTHKIPFPVLILLTISLHAQRNADWTANLTGNAQRIILQQMTGVPIIQTEKAYVGIDPQNQKVAWTMERSGDKALSSVIEVSYQDFFNMHYTPFVLVRNNLVDSRTGALILDKAKEGYKRVDEYEVVPDLNGVLLRSTAEGKLRLYFVSMSENKKMWQVEVGKTSFMDNVKADDGKEEEERIDVPMHTTIVTADKKHIVYRFKKNLAAINVQTGALLWTDKIDAASIFLSPDEKTVLVIEAASMGMMAMATAGTDIKMNSNKLIAYDLLTGKSPWNKEIKADEKIRWVDPHPDFLTIVHKKGCNLYNYATGDPLWKKDFAGRRVVEIQPNAEGFLISYHSGYKRMQVDKEGKNLWKKPEVQEFEDGEEEDVPEDGGFDRYSYQKGDILVEPARMRFVPAKGSGLKRWQVAFDAATRLVYDPDRHNLVVLNNSKLMVLNPDKFASAGIQYKFGFENTAAFHTMEIRPNSYFLTSDQEFAIINPDNDLAFHKYYRRPFDSKGMLMDMASAGLSIGAAMMETSAVVNAGTGAGKATSASLGMMPPGSGNTELRKANTQMQTAGAMSDAASFIPPGRFEAFKQSRDFAYYFSSEKADDKSAKLLVKVNKDSGDEADKLIFDDARPIYQVDEIQRKVYYANKTLLKVFNL